MESMLTEIDEFKVDLAHEIGRGAFGTVYLAFDNNTKGKYAGKKLTRSSSEILANLEHVKQLGRIKDGNNDGDRNVLLVHKVIEIQGHIWVFMPFCELGDLNSYFANYFHNITNVMKFQFMQQIMKGLKFLHGRKIVHRDIKPANILVSRSPNETTPVLMLTDFDLSKFIGPEDVSMMSSNVGTAPFMAPEFWNMIAGENLEYTKSVDTFATGLVYLSILQAQMDSTLKPCLEDESASSEEKGQFIGLAMQIRQQNLQEPFTVAVLKLSDDIYVRRMKHLICQMTNTDHLQRPETDYICDVITSCLQDITNTSSHDKLSNSLHVGQPVTTITCTDLKSLHVTEQGEVVQCLDGAVKMFTLKGDLVHEWKAKIDEPTGIANMTINGTEYIAISQIISESSAKELKSAEPGVHDTIQIQIRNKEDRALEAIPWGQAAYTVPGECGLGRNLAMLKSGQLALAVKSADEAPCIIHVLDCSKATFECIRQIRTNSTHPPAICGLTLGDSNRDAIVVADVWNSKEESSIVAYDEETGSVIREIDEKRLQKASKEEEFTLSSIWSTSYDTLLISERSNNRIYEMTLQGEVSLQEVMNAWDHNIWTPSCMSWHTESHSLAVSHKKDNIFKNITDAEESVTIFTMY